MKIPEKLYRFRPLFDGERLTNEFDALEKSYIYAPPFKSMNDPMEACYSWGDSSDGLFKSVLGQSEDIIDQMYKIVKETTSQFGLVSFTDTFDNLPMWAYYANNFSGMCLEFDPIELQIGDVQSDRFYKVNYERETLPPINFANILSNLEQTVTDRLIRKRIEWAHEKEWRLLAGEVGPKYYLDDALRRVFLGPNIDQRHLTHICDILDRRPVEVLKCVPHGFDFAFETIKPARGLGESERVGGGTIDSEAILNADPDLKPFLGDLVKDFIELCEQMVSRPNAEEIFDACVQSSAKNAIPLSMTYRLRNCRKHYQNYSFDRSLCRLEPIF